MSDLARTVEALLFLSPDPVSVADLAEATEATEGQVAEAIELLSEDLAEGKRGIVLRLIGGGFTLASDRTPLQNRPWSPAPSPPHDDRIVRPGHGGSHGADPADVDVAPEEGR